MINKLNSILGTSVNNQINSNSSYQLRNGGESRIRVYHLLTNDSKALYDKRNFLSVVTAEGYKYNHKATGEIYTATPEEVAKIQEHFLNLYKSILVDGQLSKMAKLDRSIYEGFYMADKFIKLETVCHANTWYGVSESVLERHINTETVTITSIKDIDIDVINGELSEGEALHLLTDKADEETPQIEPKSKKSVKQLKAKTEIA